MAAGTEPSGTKPSLGTSSGDEHTYATCASTCTLEAGDDERRRIHRRIAAEPA